MIEIINILRQKGLYIDIKKNVTKDIRDFLNIVTLNLH